MVMLFVVETGRGTGEKAGGRNGVDQTPTAEIRHREITEANDGPKKIDGAFQHMEFGCGSG
jgi:hypothetical protein